MSGTSTQGCGASEAPDGRPAHATGLTLENLQPRNHSSIGGLQTQIPMAAPNYTDDGPTNDLQTTSRSRMESVPVLDLQQLVVRLLSDSKFNPYGGSVPLEKIHRICSTNEMYCALYEQVVGKGKGRLHSLLDRQPDVTVFPLEGGRRWRVRLTSNLDYAQADQLESQAARDNEERMISSLSAYLALQPGGSCDVDAFLEHLRASCAMKNELPNRGDLVRLILKHSKTPNDLFVCSKVPKAWDGPPTCRIHLNEDRGKDMLSCVHGCAMGDGQCLAHFSA